MRWETRLYLVNDDLSVLGDLAFEWPELKAMGIVASIRQEGDRPTIDITLRYYISSAKLNAQALLEASRAHWSIESQLHWRLDVGMREDECRIRRKQAGENIAAIRHMASMHRTARRASKPASNRNVRAAIMPICRKSWQDWGFRKIGLYKIVIKLRTVSDLKRTLSTGFDYHTIAQSSCMASLFAILPWPG